MPVHYVVYASQGAASAEVPAVDAGLLGDLHQLNYHCVENDPRWKSTFKPALIFFFHVLSRGHPGRDPSTHGATGAWDLYISPTTSPVCMTPSREILRSFSEVWLEIYSHFTLVQSAFPHATSEPSLVHTRHPHPTTTARCEQQLVRDSRSQPCYFRRTD